MAAIFFFVVALMVGAGYPIQAGVNATISQYQGHPLLAAFTNTTVASLVLLVLIVAMRIPFPAMGQLVAAPFWAWGGGFLGAFFVFSSLVLAPKMGAAAYVSTTIVGTMTAALIIDHFGFLAYKPQAITLQRFVGAVMVIGGMFLIQWKR